MSIFHLNIDVLSVGITQNHIIDIHSPDATAPFECFLFPDDFTESFAIIKQLGEMRCDIEIL